MSTTQHDQHDDSVLASTTHNGHTWRVRRFHDEDATNPRENDNLWRWFTAHRKYNIGDESFGTVDALERAVAAFVPNQRDRVMVPLYLLDHSGLALSTRPFGDPWDSGQLGIVVVSRASLREEKMRLPAAMKCLEAEVAVMNQYLNGDVYGFVIESRPMATPDAAWETHDSMSGFFGSDPTENGMVEYWPDFLAQLLTKPVSTGRPRVRKP